MKYKIILIMVALLGINHSLTGKEERAILFSNDRLSTRSVLSLPEASIDDAKMLAISFDDIGNYAMYIMDAYGEVIFTSFLPATGDEYMYDLSTIIDGDYSITLEGPSGVYEGYFYLD